MITAAVRAETGRLLTLPAVWLTAAVTLVAAGLLRELDHTQAGLLVLGTLAGTTEVRTTLLAVPRRGTAATARAVAVTLAATPVSAGAALLADRAGAAAYLVMTALLATGVSSLIRHPAASAGLLTGWYMIAGPVLRALVPASAGWLPDALRTGPALVWTIAVLAVAAVVLSRRDA
ncbi:hypothetical protein [Symbioplanes lichenis]|uniref:hypothetical protein n=1 Tax=Symbioplanes lichenis TaxID=1629072 RepID=UPI002739CCE2|nr:hypothetical protein [Actinoplanes lichenis]